MPAKAQPPPPPPKPPVMVRSAGNQADFEAPAAELAVKLGWDGPDHYITNDIRVDDARKYIAKVMHEHFQAAAKGEPQPDFQAACEHLAVDNPDEQVAIEEALAAAYKAGDGVAVTNTPASVATANASIAGSGAAMLDRMGGQKGNG